MNALLLKLLVQRIGLACLSLLAVSVLVFAITGVLPGDAAQEQLGQEATPESLAALRAQMGLDVPAHQRYLGWLGGLVRGDLGVSSATQLPVAELIASRLPNSLLLAAITALFSVPIALTLGISAAVWRGSWFDRAASTGAVAVVSVPEFLVATLAVLIFAVQLKWLPSFGRGEVVSLGNLSTGLLTIDGLRHLVLPAFTLSLFPMTLVLRLVRSEMLEVLRSDYIKFARARGLKRRAIHFGHALKNTMVPVITITGLQLGGIIAFAIVTETVFQWPGMGLLFIQAVQFADVPVMAAYLCLIALVFVVINLVVDLLYFVVDPRLRSGMTRAGGAH